MDDVQRTRTYGYKLEELKQFCGKLSDNFFSYKWNSLHVDVVDSVSVKQIKTRLDQVILNLKESRSFFTLLSVLPLPGS